MTYWSIGDGNLVEKFSQAGTWIDLRSNIFVIEKVKIAIFS